MALNFRRANFSDLLALMIEQQVPMGDALLLTADASGDPELQAAAQAMSAAIVRGEPQPANAGMPSFLYWLLVQSSSSADLVAALRQAARTYRLRATQQAEWIKFIAPILAGVVIGGGATLIYALALFTPFVAMLKEIAN